MPSLITSQRRSRAATRIGQALLLACALPACGARSALDDASPKPGPAPAAIEVPRFDCHPSEAARPMLAARVGPAVYFAYPNRTAKQAFTFDIPEGMYVTEADVLARGDHVAAYVVVAALGGASEPPPFAEVVVLHVDGSVVLHEQHDFAYQGWGSDSHLHGNDNGLFVLTLMEVKAGLGLVIEGNEARPFTERVGGRTDPDGAGRMVVWNADASSTADLDFFDTREGTFTPSLYRSEDPFDDLASSPALLASGLLYIERNPARLVFEDASGRSELPIDIALDGPGHATPGYMSSGGATLFMLGGADELDARYLATHFATGEVRELRLAPPAGFSLPGDYWNPPPIDAGGRLIVPLHSDQAVALHATRDGETWEPVGRPIVASGYPTSTKVVAQTVIFDGYGGGMEIPGLLPAWAAQLVGPQGGEGIELVRSDPGAPDNPIYAEDEISPDGACLAYFRSGSLHVVEVSDYSASDLGIAASGASAEMSWIPLPR